MRRVGPRQCRPARGQPGIGQDPAEGGIGAAGELDAETVETTPDTESGPHYYTATADVLSALAKAPTGHDVDVSVADLWAPTGYGCVGGWSLTVVYQYPRPNPEYAPSARAVYVYEGHVLQRSNDPATTTGISGFQVGAEDASGPA